jgi:hypothetical protein
VKRPTTILCPLQRACTEPQAGDADTQSPANTTSLHEPGSFRVRFRAYRACGRDPYGHHQGALDASVILLARFGTRDPQRSPELPVANTVYREGPMFRTVCMIVACAVVASCTGPEHDSGQQNAAILETVQPARAGVSSREASRGSCALFTAAEIGRMLTLTHRA